MDKRISQLLKKKVGYTQLDSLKLHFFDELRKDNCWAIFYDNLPMKINIQD